jgi:hypothetical protein
MDLLSDFGKVGPCLRLPTGTRLVILKTWNQDPNSPVLAGREGMKLAFWKETLLLKLLRKKTTRCRFTGP